MARPDGRAFLRPLGAGSPRGGALRGASALAPGLGLVAASVWARPCGRASRPGPRPSPPHTPPARLGAADGKAGGCQPCGLVGAPVRALWARSSRPQRPAGRYPCPPWAAWAPPAPPACGGRGVVAAGRRLRRLRSAPLRGLPAASRCAGPPSRAARPSPLRGPLRGPCPPASPAPVAASVLRRGPAPTLWGLWGRPRLRPGRVWLRPAAPRWPACGSACAGAALPPLGPPGVAAPPRCGVPPPSRGAASAPSGRGPCAAAILTPRVRALPALRVAALVRASRGWGAGVRRLRAGLPHRKPSDKAKTSRLRRALSDDLRCGVAQIRAMPRPDASIRRQKNPLPHAAGFLQASTCRPKSLCSKNGVNRQEAG